MVEMKRYVPKYIVQFKAVEGITFHIHSLVILPCRLRCIFTLLQHEEPVVSKIIEAAITWSPNLG